MNIEEHVVQSSSGKYSRHVWLLNDDNEKDQKLCVFLDAEYYLNHLQAPRVIEDLRRQGILPAVTCIFVSCLDAEARHYDYTCNDQYSDFIAHDILRWAKARVTGVSLSDNLICGLSLSGLASAYLALTYPLVFSRALCQSGSFWWNQEWLANSRGLDAASQSRFWISVGDQEDDMDISHPPTGLYQEVSQLAASTRMADTLKDAGISINYNLFSGRHEIGPWQAELPSALKWLLGQQAEHNSAG